MMRRTTLAAVTLVSSALVGTAFVMSFNGLTKTAPSVVGPQYYRRLEDSHVTKTQTDVRWSVGIAASLDEDPARATSRAIEGALDRLHPHAEPNIAILQFHGDFDHPDVLGAEVLRVLPSIKVVVGFTTSQEKQQQQQEEASEGSIVATLVDTGDLAFKSFHIAANAAAGAVRSPTFWQQAIGDAEQSTFLLFPCASFAQSKLAAFTSAIDTLLPASLKLGQLASRPQGSRSRSFVTLRDGDGAGTVLTSSRSGGLLGLILQDYDGAELEGLFPTAW
jgi:hypothetical protein